jgi:hypothetical protein
MVMNMRDNFITLKMTNIPVIEFRVLNGLFHHGKKIHAHTRFYAKLGFYGRGET